MLWGINLSNEDIVIGIDFGTTNSAAGIYRDGKFEVISSMGHPYFPSVVAINEDGDVLVGHYAYKQMVSNATGTLSEFKLAMGTDETLPFNGEYKRPQEITSYILSHIKKNAEVILGKPINKAVITVPVGFNNDARNAIIEAGEIAGFEVKKIINEPTAACLAYSATKNILGNIFVFDIGGGTLDIIIGSFNGSELVTKVTGDAKVGGREITIALRDYVKRGFEEQYGLKLEDYITPEYNPLVALWIEAENAKKELSDIKSTKMHKDSFIVTKEGKHINLDVDINRSKLNELSNHVVKRCKEEAIKALSDFGEDIDHLIFVGGPTKMPFLKESIEKVLGKSATEGIDPMLCVVEGASMYSGGGIRVKNVNSLTLSVVTDEKFSDPLIPKNTLLPAEATRTYEPMDDNQTSVDIQIVEGESILAKQNHSLHTFTLKGLPMKPKEEVSIQVKLKVDENGIMELSAEELSTKSKLSAQINSSVRMSSEEIKKAGLDNDNLLKNYEEKLKQKDIINDAEEAIFEAKNLVENFSDMLISDKNMLNGNVGKLEALLNSDSYNFDLIKLNTKKLQNLIKEIESDIF